MYLDWTEKANDLKPEFSLHLDILLQVRASCQRGASCPYRHVRGDKTIVCKVSASMIKLILFCLFLMFLVLSIG